MNCLQWLQTLDRGELPDADPNWVTRNLRLLRTLGFIDRANRLTERGRELLAIWTTDERRKGPS